MGEIVETATGKSKFRRIRAYDTFWGESPGDAGTAVEIEPPEEETPAAAALAAAPFPGLAGNAGTLALSIT